MKSKLSKSLTVLFWLLFAAACAGLYIYIYVIPDINGALTQTTVLGYGKWQISAPARCIVVRSETVVSARQAGKLSCYANENEKTRKGTKIADVYPPGSTAQSYVLENTGVVSYFIDGYESYFTPETIESIDPSWAYDLDIKPENVNRNETEKDEPIYKTIDSDTWYMVLFMAKADAENFTEGQSLTVAFDRSVTKDTEAEASEAAPEENEKRKDASEETPADVKSSTLTGLSMTGKDGQIKGTVTAVYDRGTKWMVVVMTRRYYEPCVSVRTEDVTVISKTYEGLEVPNTAICYDEDGNPGVMVGQINGSYLFTRVNILTESSENSLCSQNSFTEKNGDGESVTVNSIRLYDEILRNADDADQ